MAPSAKAFFSLLSSAFSNGRASSYRSAGGVPLLLALRAGDPLEARNPAALLERGVLEPASFVSEFERRRREELEEGVGWLTCACGGNAEALLARLRHCSDTPPSEDDAALLHESGTAGTAPSAVLCASSPVAGAAGAVPGVFAGFLAFSVTGFLDFPRLPALLARRTELSEAVVLPALLLALLTLFTETACDVHACGLTDEPDDEALLTFAAAEMLLAAVNCFEGTSEGDGRR